MGNWTSYPATEPAAEAAALEPTGEEGAAGAGAEARDRAESLADAPEDLAADAAEARQADAEVPPAEPAREYALPACLYESAKAGREVVEAASRAPWAGLAPGAWVRVRNAEHPEQSFMGRVVSAKAYEDPDAAVKAWADAAVRPMAAALRASGGAGLRLARAR